MRRFVTAIILTFIGLPLLETICHANELTEAAAKEEIIKDWMSQDHNRAIDRCFVDSGNASVETKMLATVLDELGDSAGPFRSRMDALIEAKAPGKDPAWKDLYISACEVRRHNRLASLRKTGSKIVYAKHYNLGGSHYAYTEGLSDAQAERHFRPGSALCLLEMDGDYGKVRKLIDDPKGVIRDPDVSYDGERILFSWKKSDREDDYHLYEMNVADEEIRQLTRGLGHADYEGVYLPSGDIVFNSTRCVQIVDCWWTEVSNLYTCDKDGKYLRRLSFDQVHTNYPQVLNDGRVIYTRWDYNDRGQLYPQPLFQMNADGTGQTECYGNNSWFPTTIAHARPIPNSDKLIAVATGHHCIQTGALIVIDVRKGRQEAEGVTLVAPRVDNKEDHRYRKVDAYTGFDGHFCYPFALNETEYIASYSAHQTGRDSMNGFSLYYVREDGAREMLAHDSALSSHQPVLLASRERPRAMVGRVDYKQKTGKYYVQDVYFGPGLEGVERGTIKKMRVVGLEFRAAGVGRNGNGGPAGRALVSTPISIRNGTWDVKVVLGETPVYEDGSAYFKAPARTPLYFQMIDENGYVVQSMRSWSTLQPGETLSCVGCHEDKNTAGAVSATATQAMQAGPKRLDDFHGPPRGFSFNQEIQPILDQHCIQCHDDRSKTKATGKVGEDKKAFSLLSTTREPKDGRHYSDAYVNLTQDGRPNKMVNWLNVQSVPPMLPPYFAGSAKSEIMPLLREGHYDVKLSRAELEKIACWIDLLVPYCGDYMEANAWDEKSVAKYLRFQEKRDAMEAIERRNIEALIEKQSTSPSP
jgi:hypothetical protein